MRHNLCSFAFMFLSMLDVTIIFPFCLLIHVLLYVHNIHAHVHNIHAHVHIYMYIILLNDVDSERLFFIIRSSYESANVSLLHVTHMLV